MIDGMARLVARSAVYVLAVVVAGNLLIVGLSWWARSTTPSTRVELAGVDNAVVVDDRVWRGAAPTAAGYESLVGAGVSTVVDLRSDSERGVAVSRLDDLPVDVVRLPIRDGQLPTDDEVDAFIETVAAADGIVFVHCGAGVGRTGAMAAAYQAAVHHAGGAGVLRRNLAVGPPSLEQMVYAARGGDHPSFPVVALSRVLDAPRRIWHHIS
jgi:protein tyrosine phosphatase (PTP) superfamily phosphohydrolase (DUF442 family)